MKDKKMKTVLGVRYEIIVAEEGTGKMPISYSFPERGLSAYFTKY